MTTRQVIKSIPCTNGKLFGTIGTQRRISAECEPVIEIYRQNNPVTVLGRTSHALKSYHISIVLCDGAFFAPGIDYDLIQKVSGYDMTADVLLEKNVLKEISLSRLYPELIDPRDRWEFSTEDQVKIVELLSLKIL